MNLIDDPWIPVLRASGKRCWIRPAEVVSEPDDPVIRLDAPRPDFNGALIQFLIGLVQTAFAPEDDDEWEEMFDQVPTVEVLDIAFKKFSFAFNLDGDGPRFMQDYDLHEGNNKSVNQLLIDYPGIETIGNNKDHFIKRNNEKLTKFSLPISAMALFCLQTNATAGGRGNLMGLREGAPFTTIINSLNDDKSPSVLWESLYLNVLEKGYFENSFGNKLNTNLNFIFPWVEKLKLGEKGQNFTSVDYHPLHVYWGMPRRIKLNVIKSEIEEKCSLSNLLSNKYTSEFVAASYGVNYVDFCLHPLSPHKINKDNQPYMPGPNEIGVNYNNWLGFVLGSKNFVRATVINRFMNTKERRRRSRFKLHAFGFKLKKKGEATVKAWRESLMPIICLNDVGLESSFQMIISQLLDVANEIVKQILDSLKHSWVNKPKELKGDFSFISDRFWQSTEPTFYEHLNQLKELLDQDPSADTEAIKISWLNYLKKSAEEIFEDLSQNSNFQANDPERIARAWNNLQKTLKGQKLKEILGFAVAQEKIIKKKKAKVTNG